MIIRHQGGEGTPPEASATSSQPSANLHTRIFQEAQMRRKLATAAKKDKRLDQLKTLSVTLAKAIDEGQDNPSALASLAKQYRETIREIEELEGLDAGDDEISNIIAIRAADGKPGAVRPDRTSVS